jgi:RND family efflux transporter MFP subunit
MTYRTILSAGALILAALTGCAQKPPEPSLPPTSVMVSYPIEREVTDHADFTARTAAVDSVDLRAHVWGYLDKVNFKEGALVKKGDLLFVIDQRPYKAALEAQKAQVTNQEATLSLAQITLDRAQRASRQGGGFVAALELDQDRSQVDQTRANLELARANLLTAQINYDFTQVTAPITGRISRYVITVGNMVQGGDQGASGGTLLTTIVSVDPMYAYFDVDEYTMLRLNQLSRAGKIKSPRTGGLPVWLGLANEEGYPHEGTINFVDNQVNPKTGTLRLRGVFPNKDEALSPGYFARVRMATGKPHKALLVSDRALDSDQGQKVLYVVTDKNEVVSRPVRLGALHDGLREITDGLKPGERVIVNGLQQIRPGSTVAPKLVDMLTVRRTTASHHGPELQTAKSR